MESISFKIITDLQEAKYFWELFSPNNTIDDEWDFRYAFYKYLNFPLHFIVGYVGEKPVGLLPLQYNTNEGMSAIRFETQQPFFEFFGGIDTDDNKVFLLSGYEAMLPEFLNQVPSFAVLAPLAQQYTSSASEALHYTDKFITNLDGIRNLDMFLDKNFEGKSKRRMKGRINHFYNNFNIEVREGTDIDLELMFSLNKDRFGERSAFHMEHRRQLFRDLMALYKADLFTIYVDGDPKAVSLGIIHKGIYYGLNSGYDYSVKDLGKFVLLTKIQRAIELESIEFDAGKNDNGWKEHFHLDKIPQYKLTLHQPQATLEIDASIPTTPFAETY